MSDVEVAKLAEQSPLGLGIAIQFVLEDIAARTEQEASQRQAYLPHDNRLAFENELKFIF